MTCAIDADRLIEESFLAGWESHRQLASTNDRALERCQDGAVATPWLVHAERQTEGRGRGKNRWWSAPGALTFSLVLESRSPATAEFDHRLSPVTALAIAESIAAIHPHINIGLKWPNDVMIDGKKACGVLIETTSGAISHCVIGIGLNVNNSLDQAPSDISESATSFIDVAGQETDFTRLLLELLQRLEREMQRLCTGESDWVARWKPKCLLAGCHVTVESGSSLVQGRCLGIDARGALLLETNSGREAILTGTIARVEE